MHIHKMCKGVLAIADPEFEENNKVTVFTVDYDEKMCIELIEKCFKFWEENIFTKLII